LILPRGSTSKIKLKDPSGLDRRVKKVPVFEENPDLEKALSGYAALLVAIRASEKLAAIRANDKGDVIITISDADVRFFMESLWESLEPDNTLGVPLGMESFEVIAQLFPDYYIDLEIEKVTPDKKIEYSFRQYNYNNATKTIRLYFYYNGQNDCYYRVIIPENVYIDHAAEPPQQPSLPQQPSFSPQPPQQPSLPLQQPPFPSISSLLAEPPQQLSFPPQQQSPLPPQQPLLAVQQPKRLKFSPQQPKYLRVSRGYKAEEVTVFDENPNFDENLSKYAALFVAIKAYEKYKIAEEEWRNARERWQVTKPNERDITVIISDNDICSFRNGVF
jgi:hypothetical protein